ncbi:hypothetical protein Tco_1298593 [Tanacetum coccineum]
MVGPLDYKIAEPIVEAEEHAIALVIDMDEDISMMFGDDDFGDDNSKGFDEEEVWEVDEEWLMAPVTPPLMPVVSDAEVAVGIAIGEIGSRVFAMEGQVQVMASQMVYAVDRLEHVGTLVEQGQQTAT